MNADEQEKDKPIEKSCLIPDGHNNLLISTPSPNDVLLGRGGHVNSHKGNIQFRNFVKEKKPAYLAFNTKKNVKSDLAAQIVAKIRSLDPPGRFLEFHKDSNMWSECSDRKARKKASQALREQSAKFHADFLKHNQTGIYPYFYPYPPFQSYTPFPPHYLAAGQYPQYPYFSPYPYPHYPSHHTPWVQFPQYISYSQQQIFRDNQQRATFMSNDKKNEFNIHDTRSNRKSPLLANQNPSSLPNTTESELTGTNQRCPDDKIKLKTLEDDAKKTTLNSPRIENEKIFCTAPTPIALRNETEDSKELKSEQKKELKDQIALPSTSQTLLKTKDENLQKDSSEGYKRDKLYLSDYDILDQASQLINTELLSWIADSSLEINKSNQNLDDQRFVRPQITDSDDNELGLDSRKSFASPLKNKNLVGEAEDGGHTDKRDSMFVEKGEKKEKGKEKSEMPKRLSETNLTLNEEMKLSHRSGRTTPCSNVQKSDRSLSNSEMTHCVDIRKEKKIGQSSFVEFNDERISNVGNASSESGENFANGDFSHDDNLSFNSMNTFSADEHEICSVPSGCEFAIGSLGDYFFRVRMKKSLQKIMCSEMGFNECKKSDIEFYLDISALYDESCTKQ